MFRSRNRLLTIIRTPLNILLCIRGRLVTAVKLISAV